MDDLQKKPTGPRMHAKIETLRLDLPADGLRLQHGGILQEVEVAYETYGTLNAAGDNAVLICTPLTMDAHAAGWHSDADRSPGWWDDMIGPGKAIDTGRWLVISSNVLGGCKGTTGPASVNPETGYPYGKDFPFVTIADMVAVQARLLRALGVKKIAAVVGGSMGGMQALEWSISHPDLVEKVICIAATTQMSAQALGFDILGRKALTCDPAWQGGEYYGGKGPEQGLKLARITGLLTYLSAGSMDKKFGREKSGVYDEKRFETGFQVENYLEYNARKFVERFDANSYLHITRAVDEFDPAAEHGSLEKAFARTNAEFLLVALSSDWLFPPAGARELAQALLGLGKIASLVELDSPYGHDAFLLEIGNLGATIGAFLGGAKREGEKQETARVAAATQPASAALDLYHRLEAMVKPASHVLDIGCGTGALIDHLYRTQRTTGFGVDIDLENVLASFRRNVPVVQGDVDNGLTLFRDDSFDYAILSETMQMLKRPVFAMKEMLRVARKGIIVFPNFACLRNRWQLGVRGRMPMSPVLPYLWWESPNIHLFSLDDFLCLCRAEHIQVETVVPMASGAFSRLLLGAGLSNLGAELVIAKITR